MCPYCLKNGNYISEFIIRISLIILDKLLQTFHLTLGIETKIELVLSHWLILSLFLRLPRPVHKASDLAVRSMWQPNRPQRAPIGTCHWLHLIYVSTWRAADSTVTVPPVIRRPRPIESTRDWPDSATTFEDPSMMPMAFVSALAHHEHHDTLK